MGRTQHLVHEPVAAAVATDAPQAAAQSAGLVRHQFDEATMCQLRELQHASLDNYHGLLELAEDYGVCLLAVFMAEWALAELGVCAHLVAYAFAVFTIGCRMRGLAEILHQSAHRSFARNKHVNYLGAVLGGWPVLQSCSVYSRSHCVDHHAALGDAERDPDYQALLAAGLYGEDLGVRSLLRYMRSLVSVRGTLSYLRYLVVNRVWASTEDAAERVTRACFYAAVVGASVRFGFAWLLLRYWAVPLCTTACWVGSLIELSEHYPLLETTDAATRTELSLSRNRLCGRVADFFFGIHDEGYHLVHHLFPRMPQWACREAHAVLMAGSAEYRSAVHCNGWADVIAHMAEAAASAGAARAAPIAALPQREQRPTAADGTATIMALSPRAHFE